MVSPETRKEHTLVERWSVVVPAQLFEHISCAMCGSHCLEVRQNPDKKDRFAIICLCAAIEKVMRRNERLQKIFREVRADASARRGAPSPRTKEPIHTAS